MSDREATLPKFVSFRGHGQGTVEVPITTTNATLYAFAFPSDPARVQQLVDETLNQVAPGAFEYLVLGHHVLLCYMHCEHCISPSDIGWQGDRESAFFIPLVEKPRDGSEPVKLVLWVPYLLINSPFGMLTGREVWGFHKTYGTTAMPKQPTDPAEFVSDTDISLVLNDNSKIEWKTLLTLRRDGVLGSPASIWGDGKAVFEAIAGALGPWTISWKDELELTLDLVKLCLEGAVPFINVKQFRDAANSERACLSQLVETDIDPTALHGAGLMPSGFNLAITQCDSHPIATDLGLTTRNPDGTFPASFGLWASINWEAGPGQIIYSAL